MKKFMLLALFIGLAAISIATENAYPIISKVTAVLFAIGFWGGVAIKWMKR